MSVHHVANPSGKSCPNYPRYECRRASDHQNDWRCRNVLRTCKENEAAAAKCRAANRSYHPSEHYCLAFISALSRSIKLIHRYLPFLGQFDRRPVEKQRKGA